jgi:hypothetical protein
MEIDEPPSGLHFFGIMLAVQPFAQKAVAL